MIPKTLEDKRIHVLRRFQELGSVLVALSGGVDSAVVATLAHEALKSQAVAVTFDSPLTPPEEIDDARKVAQTIGIEHQVSPLNELKIAAVLLNPRDRCYHCKLLRFRQAQVAAMKLGLSVVVDGSTVSDESEHRPGLLAIEELGVISPLREAGITKAESRQLAHHYGLSVADKPSNSCLATRIPYGEELTESRLARIAAAETIVRAKIPGTIVRVRDHGDVARIEVLREKIPDLLSEPVVTELVEELTALGYEHISVDLRGYRFGSFDEESA